MESFNRCRQSAAYGRESVRPYPAFGHPLPDLAAIKVEDRSRGEGRRQPIIVFAGKTDKRRAKSP
jgi:hypothetical protein